MHAASEADTVKNKYFISAHTGLRDLSAMVSGELVCQQAVILLLLISYLKHNLLQSSISYHGDIRREPPSYQVKPEVSWMIHSTFQHDSQHVCISHSDFYLGLSV